MIKQFDKNKSRKKRHSRMRNTVIGTAGKPRLNLKKSNKNIYTQIIDDEKGVTLVSCSTLDKALDVKNTCNKEAAKIVGAELAKRAIKVGIEEVVFDRSGYIYHGKVKELADAARENGLKF